MNVQSQSINNHSGTCYPDLGFRLLSALILLACCTLQMRAQGILATNMDGGSVITDLRYRA